MNQIEKAEYKLLVKLANIPEINFDDLGRIAFSLLGNNQQ